MNAKREARAKAFAALKELRNRPTLFNPHYEIKARACQDPELRSPTGPRLKTLQWEGTGRRSG